MAQMVQLFVNGTIVFSDMTDDVDKLVVKVDGKVYIQTSTPARSEDGKVYELSNEGMPQVFR